MHSLGRPCGDIHLGHFKNINSIELIEMNDGYTRLFIDGFINEEAVGAEAIVASRVFKKRLPNNSSASSADARGILMVLTCDISLWAVSSCSLLTVPLIIM